MTFVLAATALGRQVLRRAGLAGVQVSERLGEVVLDHLELRDLLADVLLLLDKHRAHASARFGSRAGMLEVFDEALDLREREADRLELDDPVDAVDRLGAIESKATFGSCAG